MPEGSYVIEGVVEGYASCFSDPFTATQGLVASDVIVHMNHGGSLRGQVLDAYSSAPIAGAQVATYENDYIDTQFWDLFGELEPSAMTKAKVFTDEEGRFTVDVMTPGTYQVQVTGRGFSPAYVKDVEIAEGRATELPPQTLIKGASIVGIVYGRDGSVVLGRDGAAQPGGPERDDGQPPDALRRHRTLHARQRAARHLHADGDTAERRPGQPVRGAGRHEAVGDQHLDRGRQHVPDRALPRRQAEIRPDPAPRVRA